MENLIHYFLPCNKLNKAYRELNLERALDEDTGPGVFSSLSSSPLDHILLYLVIE